MNSYKTRRFNVTGACNQRVHYMAKLDERIKVIRESYVDCGSYFVISRGRQYGKTTTLKALAKYLAQDYLVFSLDFQKMPASRFADEAAFTAGFADKLLAALRNMEADEGEKETLRGLLTDFKEHRQGSGMDDLFECLSGMCEKSPRPVVLIIDEIDSAGNNQVFVDFLALLRAYYLERDETPIFYSVILAGVYSIKNLKLKLRPEVEHQYNSPWNIAADFDMDMSLSAAQIAGMLEEYEDNQHTGMDVRAVSEEIYAYTSGYPVLVSSICKRIDEGICGNGDIDTMQKAWTKEGIAEAVKYMLKVSSPLFENMIRQLDLYKELHAMLENILYRGMKIPFSPDEKAISMGLMFGFLTERNGQVAIANRIFEMYLLNYFMTKEAVTSEVYAQGGSDRIGFIRNNRLDMELVLKKFVAYFSEVYSEKDEKFVEKYGRKFFLLYLKPIINGVGNYYLEAQTRDERRTDVVVDYRGEQFILELKIWHGSEYNERGRRQLADYLDYYHKDKGYMLSFNFNRMKEPGVREIRVGKKTIVEAVV